MVACGILTHRLGGPYPEPAPAGYSDERLLTQDGLELGAWYRQGEGKVAVVILHGDENSRRAMTGQTPPYEALGASVLLVSLRAHGDSQGRFNDFGLSARHDVIAAVEFLEKKGLERIYLDGVSLGAAASVFAGGELKGRVAGYILECLYLDLDSAVDRRTHMFLPPGLSSLATWSLEFVSPLWLEDYRQISPVKAISEIPESVPILILGGAKDDYVPPEHLQRLSERVASHCQLVLFPEAAHNDLRQQDPVEYDRLVTEFCLRKESR